MNLNEELEEGHISDGGYDDLSSEDHERMMNGLEHVRSIIGDEESSKISDADITDALYHYFFDIEQTTAWLLDEQQRRLAAQARKDVFYSEDGKPLPMPPPEDYADWSPPTDDASGRHNVPFVRLTSSSDYVSSPDAETTRTSTRPGSVWTLYTITELTERSENSRHGDFPPEPRDSNTTFRTSTTSDYGQVLERPTLHMIQDSSPSPERPQSLDPNVIPLSPSSSAEHRLSMEIGSPPGPPMIDYSAASSSAESSRPPTMLDYNTESIPDIPDWISKSTARPPQGAVSSASLLTRSVKPSDDTRSEASVRSVKTAQSTQSIQSGKGEKKSKLSALASSRSSARSNARSNVSSVSSHTSVPETEATSTNATYTALHPAATSFVSLLPPRPPSSDAGSDLTDLSSMTRKVEQAIQSALALEAMERQALQEPSPRESTVPPTPPPKSPQYTSSRTPTEVEDHLTPRASPVPLPIPRRASAGSYATLSVASSSPSVPQSPPVAPRSPPSSPPRAQAPSTSPQPRQLSKLAKLAQAKAQEQSKSKPQSTSHPGLILPRTTTEYLTPTANGPTATTAITTSYQSLSGLLSRNQLKVPPSQPTVAPLPKAASPRVPFAGSASAKSSEPKQSKLAMKSKSSRTKASTEPEPEPEDAPVFEVPMFSPSAIRSRAPPSAFATLLVSDASDGTSVNGSESAHLCEHHQAERERDRRRSNERSRTSEEDAKRRRSRGGRIDTVLPPTMPSLRGFAFDVPSPDDIVYSARKGTSLGQRTTSSTVSSAMTASAR
ncbi:hypothetical protein BD311DRAFT_775557 [Dichomitus squalens]|uniref:HBS1-like protein N-terminal domain-containing protein n=1 Tax=Dichomitus squalens TaxID=114155 RepID=A0A4Q9MXC2_9APHY|nr:hypothetical protein BD311DRAFT_775557 [Dichomitus squalens]